ncbi:MAG: xanthine dehydrogenase accessory protein XdhC [Polaromonas sp.]|nr:xanthine dehydrogenase accessory protein XdhC [Polaromonas sp.]
MSPLADLFLSRLLAAPAVLVRVHSTEGSAPRDAGAWMAVFTDSLLGTIGGGHLEHQAIERARELLALQLSKSGLEQGAAAPELMRMALGPSLGQCCGGVVHLSLQRVNAQDAATLRQQLDTPRMPVALFGGGHVGHALAELLARLPVALHWIDSREGIFPDALPAHVVCEHSEPVQGAVASLAPDSRVLIMSFSHAEDLDVLALCLTRQRQRGDLPYIGLIGSQTKWASFRHRLEARGFTSEELAHVTCPIGVPGIEGKEPEVIAVAVAAQLLQARQTKQSSAA